MPRAEAADDGELVAAVAHGERTALARAITLVESERPERAAWGEAVLQALLPRAGRSWRVGITGVPGVGKSTFIEALGLFLVERGHRVAVLAVDPTSERTGGSILGDKTRMPRLAAHPRAYIRPSPARGLLGGVGRMTRETMLLCEAAGYDIVLVETVGVGQSETLVAGMVDCFMVLALPGAGDELQGIKKGIVELADLVVITKADGDNRLRAEQAASHWQAALQIIVDHGASWRPAVLTTSAIEGRGIEGVWEVVERHRQHLLATGELTVRRQRQTLRWFQRLVDAQLRSRLLAIPEVANTLRETETAVAAGELTPGAALRRMMVLVDTRLGSQGSPTIDAATPASEHEEN